MAVFFNKWLYTLVFTFFCSAANSFVHEGNIESGRAGNRWHPFHVSVTEINHNMADKTLEISCKIFTDDFENILAKKFQAKIDLVNSKDRATMDKYVETYIQEHLRLKVNDKLVTLQFLGYEVDKEAVYAYLQGEGINNVKEAEITNSILYDLFTDQVGINHMVVNGKRKSTKLDYPDSVTVLQF